MCGDKQLQVIEEFEAAVEAAVEAEVFIEIQAARGRSISKRRSYLNPRYSKPRPRKTIGIQQVYRAYIEYRARYCEFQEVIERIRL